MMKKSASKFADKERQARLETAAVDNQMAARIRAAAQVRKHIAETSTGASIISQAQARDNDQSGEGGFSIGTDVCSAPLAVDPEHCCFCGVKLPGVFDHDTEAHSTIGNNNAEPVIEKGRCCNKCNREIVIPARFQINKEIESDAKKQGFVGVGRPGEGVKQACAEVWRAMQGDLKLSHPGGSAFHRLCEGIRPTARDRVPAPPLVSDIIEKDHQVFVIEHDWAAAFANAENFDDGEIVLPYDKTVFEYRVNGLRTCAICHKDLHRWIVFVETKVMWLLMLPPEDSKICRKIHDFLDRQIRAVSIVLDAEIAVTQMIRAPEKLNRKRERLGRAPLKDFHIVNLNRRRRTEPYVHEPNEEHRSSPRCHFRRGHWRHYERFKTWIKWCLVGDPDLGFVDKHYKL